MKLKNLLAIPTGGRPSHGGGLRCELEPVNVTTQIGVKASFWLPIALRLVEFHLMPSAGVASRLAHPIYATLRFGAPHHPIFDAKIRVYPLSRHANRPWEWLAGTKLENDLENVFRFGRNIRPAGNS